MLRKTTILTTRRQALVMAATGVALAGCGGGVPGFDSGPSTPPPQPGQPQQPTGQTLGAGKVRVGLILPLSSAGAGAVVANSLRNAAELSLSEFQGADITILVKDDRGTADGAKAAAEEALREGAELILGPLFSPSVRAAGQVARAANRPLIGFSTDATAAARGIYLLSFLAETEVERVISYAGAQGKRSFGALIPDTAYGTVAQAEFQQAVSKRGGRVVVMERFGANAREAITRVAAAFSQIDALFLPANAGEIGQIAQGLQQAGFDPNKIKPLGTGVWNDAQTFSIPAIRGGWFAAPDTAGFNAFAGRYRAKFNSDPTRTATLAYDAVSLTAALVRTQGPQRFAESVLTNASGFAGADGVFRFRPDGLNDRGLAVLQVGNGTATTVSAAPRELGRSNA